MVIVLECLKGENGPFFENVAEVIYAQVMYGYRLVLPRVPRYTTYQVLKFDPTTIVDDITINDTTALRNALMVIL